MRDVEHTVPPRRAYIARRAEKFLPSGCVIRHIFGCQRLHPLLDISVIGDLISLFVGYRVVAVTDEAIYVLAARYGLRWRPTKLLRTLPRTTCLLDREGFFFHRVQLGPERVWVNWRFNDDLRATDAQAPQPRWNMPDGSPRPRW